MDTEQNHRRNWHLEDLHIFLREILFQQLIKTIRKLHKEQREYQILQEAYFGFTELVVYKTNLKFQKREEGLHTPYAPLARDSHCRHFPTIENFCNETFRQSTPHEYQIQLFFVDC